MKEQALPIVFLVDDEPNILKAIARCFAELNVDIHTFERPQEALLALDQLTPDLVISDQRMPGMNGTEMLEKMKQRCDQIQCILLSAYHDFSAVASAFNQRTIERYICKPWDDRELLFVVEKILSSHALLESESISKAESKANKTAIFHGMISASPLMFSLFQRIEKAATANVPIFITGETGTGKERVAEACHNEGFRKKQPFVAVNCANFSEHLMESQLFGHKKGAFTGASSNQQGLLSAAAEGTLFLDEVTTIPMALQAKLLRVIQEREFCPLGSHELVSFKAQLVTASSTRLQDAVKAGQFREDLFYRLNVIVINLPPLRDRHDDAEHIACYFLKEIGEREQRKKQTFKAKALRLISRYPWPGNVRQLENFIHSLVVMNTEREITEVMCQAQLAEFDLSMKELQVEAPKPDLTITPNDSPLSPKPTVLSASVSIESEVDGVPATMEVRKIEPLWSIEKQAIEQAIEACEGNIPRAATYLEVSASTLYRKLQAWQARGLTSGVIPRQ